MRFRHLQDDSFLFLIHGDLNLLKVDSRVHRCLIGNIVVNLLRLFLVCHPSNSVINRRKCGQFANIDDPFQRGLVKHLRLWLLPAARLQQHCNRRNSNENHHGGDYEHLRFNQQFCEGMLTCLSFVLQGLLNLGCLRLRGLRLLLFFCIHDLSLLCLICILLVVISLNSVYHI